MDKLSTLFPFMWRLCETAAASIWTQKLLKQECFNSKKTSLKYKITLVTDFNTLKCVEAAITAEIIGFVEFLFIYFRC